MEATPDPLPQEQATLPPRSPGETAAYPAAPPAALAPGPSAVRGLSAFEILGELGRGGMGVVYKARQVELNRLCALKMILAGGHAGASDLARFRTEAEAIARLQHPGIVAVYEVGDYEGKPFLSLEFCPGGSLEKKLAGKPIPPRDAAVLVRKLAEAVQAAHEAKVVHRDLKPANVLLTRADSGTDPASWGEPKITDFGLAKKIDEVGQTQTGSVMGTPSYMAPEQAAGKKDIGPAADVYALGAILYECLTGRPPFVAATPMDTLMQVLESAPTPPQVLNPAVPRDLQTVCLKCLEKEPRQRYATAQALADDLGRWLGGESIHARSYNLLDRMAAALDRSHYDVHFAAWGNMMLGFAAVIGIGHVATTAVFLARSTEESVPLITAIHAVMLAALLLLFWRNRPEGLLPRTAAERQLWCVLAGFVAACVMMGMTDRLMGTPERPHEPLRMYPPFLIVSGMVFLVLGSSYWGGCYLFAGAFWVLALVVPQWLEMGPAAFGLAWTGVLVAIGLRLRRLQGARGSPASGGGRGGGEP